VARGWSWLVGGFLLESDLLNYWGVSCYTRSMRDDRLRHAIGAPLLGHLSGEIGHPLMKGKNMSKAVEVMPEIELTHEVIVKLVSEMENGLAYDKETENATRADIKKLKDARRQVSKSVYGRVHEVSYLVNQALQKNITTNKKVSEDSGVSMSTISRYDWIGSTLSIVAMSETGLTKTAEKLAAKSLNLLITGVLKKDDMLNIKDIEGWKQVIQDKTFKLPSAPKLDAVTEAIGNGSYDDALGKLESAITTSKKMMIVKA
jgi:hypothetical protein